MKILRFDRAGNPIPFAATGRNALFVDPPMQVNFWHDVYPGMDVDRHGNIYYAAKVDAAAASRPVSAYHRLHRQMNVYDADGNLQKRALLTLDRVRGVQVDDEGNLYAAGKHSVQVIDCQTGELVGEFGSYGNMDCRGKGSDYPHPELPFGMISALSVWNDRLFAVDVLNRRIVKCRIVYGGTKGIGSGE